MIRKRHMLLFLIVGVLLAVAGSASADCRYGVVDIATVSGTDPDGSTWKYTTYYMGYTCSDGYLDDERPRFGGGGGGTGDPPPPPPPPPPPTGCSLSECLGDCDAHYLEEAGVEVMGDTIMEHYTGLDCGILCMEMARLSWNTCRGICTADCDLT